MEEDILNHMLPTLLVVLSHRRNHPHRMVVHGEGGKKYGVGVPLLPLQGHLLL